MTAEDKATLRALAESATPPLLHWWPTAARVQQGDIDPDAAAYIAAANPKAVLALLDEVERLREAADGALWTLKALAAKVDACAYLTDPTNAPTIVDDLTAALGDSA